MKSKTKKALIIVAVVITVLLLVEFVFLNLSYKRVFKDADNMTYMTVIKWGCKDVEITDKAEINKILDVFKSKRYQVKLIPNTKLAGFQYDIKLFDKKGGAWYYRVMLANDTIINDINYYDINITDELTKLFVEIGKTSERFS